MFVSVHAMTVGAQYVALIYFRPQAVQRNFNVLADTEHFFAACVVKVQRGRMGVVAALRATALGFYHVYHFAPLRLKPARDGGFARRIVPALRAAIFLPSARRFK
jgi:hypothetical protein